MSEKRDLPGDLRYTREHEWVRISPTEAVMGVTDHAQEALGEVTYVELPEAGKSVNQGDALAVVESAKASSEVYAPVGGTVSEVNDKLEESPGLINESPYGEGWICKLTGVDASLPPTLLTAEQYSELLESADSTGSPRPELGTKARPRASRGEE